MSSMMPLIVAVTGLTIYLADAYTRVENEAFQQSTMQTQHELMTIYRNAVMAYARDQVLGKRPGMQGPILAVDLKPYLPKSFEGLAHSNRYRNYIDEPNTRLYTGVEVSLALAQQLEPLNDQLSQAKRVGYTRQIGGAVYVMPLWSKPGNDLNVANALVNDNLAGHISSDYLTYFEDF